MRRQVLYSWYAFLIKIRIFLGASRVWLTLVEWKRRGMNEPREQRGLMGMGPTKHREDDGGGGFTLDRNERLDDNNSINLTTQT
jgi:hypothetical protein